MLTHRLFFLLLSILTMAGCARSLPRHIRIERKAAVKPSGKFYWPVDKPTVLSPFGPRGKKYHTGIDVRGRRGGGDPAYASRAGRVMSVGWVKGYGKQVEIHHADGYKTRYAHLKSIKVKLGQRVKTRQIIGIVGATGRASAPHVHFEVKTPSGAFIDPATMLK